MKRHLSLAWLSLAMTLLLTPFSAYLKSDSLPGKVGPISTHSVQTQQGGTTILVTTNLDFGVGSLREAINQANLLTGPDTINFVPGIGPIDVGMMGGLGLPAITEAVTIDAGSSRVELNGTNAGFSFGLEILASGVTVRGLAINRFQRRGISISANNCIIQNNFIGTSAAGTAALPNLQGGIELFGNGNQIGGTTPAERNIISGNGGSAMRLSLASNNTIQGNFVGTDVTGLNPLGNGAGVVLSGSCNDNTIGGIVAGAGNVIANNSGRGVDIFGDTGNAILGNSIFNNGSLGINLSDDSGVSPNDICDADTGANDRQNYPVLDSAFSSGSSITISGLLEGTMGTTFRIEFFWSSDCDSSGNGEGEVFIGATTVNTPGTNCIAGINATFPVSVPVGSVVTATATDPSNNTSEFSGCMVVTGAPSCTPTCPSDILRFTSESSSSCGTVVTFSVGVSGDCGTPSCVPPSGSVFAVGTTNVSCTEKESESSCSFNVTVIDQTPPRIECSPGVTAVMPPGQQSVAVTYPQPSVTDNCGQTRTTCVPPSGSPFPRGSTLITCTAVDDFDNTSRCFFFVTVFDGQPPVITCPPDVSVVPPAGQTSVVVNYPPPSVSDNFPGTTFSCTPESGSTFQRGLTTVVCTATDADRNQSTCSFTVGVGGPQARVNVTGLEFAANPTRKPPKPAKNPCAFFSIDNIGFSPLALTFDSLRRTGTDVTSGRISDPNDVNSVPETGPTKFFTVFRVNPNQSLTQIAPGQALTQVQPGQSQQFCVKFAALIPGLAGKTSGLAATDVLPSLLTSTLTFRQNGGANINIPIQARVSTGVVLVNLTNRRAVPEVLFTRSGDEIIVSYAVFDSNLDVTRARYEFVDTSDQVVAGPFEIDLTATISSANLVRGQTFSVDQRFSGANSNPNVTGVRLTVFDGETSTGAPSASVTLSSAAIQEMNRVERVTLYPPIQTLR